MLQLRRGHEYAENESENETPKITLLRAFNKIVLHALFQPGSSRPLLWLFALFRTLKHTQTISYSLFLLILFWCRYKIRCKFFWSRASPRARASSSLSVRIELNFECGATMIATIPNGMLRVGLATRAWVMQRHEHYAAQSCLLWVVLAAKSSTTNAHRQLDVIVAAAAAVERVTPSQLCCCLWVARAAMNVIVEREREDRDQCREQKSQRAHSFAASKKPVKWTRLCVFCLCFEWMKRTRGGTIDRRFCRRAWNEWIATVIRVIMQRSVRLSEGKCC